MNFYHPHLFESITTEDWIVYHPDYYAFCLLLPSIYLVNPMLVFSPLTFNRNMQSFHLLHQGVQAQFLLLSRRHLIDSCSLEYIDVLCHGWLEQLYFNAYSKLLFLWGLTFVPNSIENQINFLVYLTSPKIHELKSVATYYKHVYLVLMLRIWIFLENRNHTSWESNLFFLLARSTQAKVCQKNSPYWRHYPEPRCFLSPLSRLLLFKYFDFPLSYLIYY